MTDESFVLRLPSTLDAYLLTQAESGMTYQILTVVLHDGRRFERVPYCGGLIDLTGLPGFWKVPFQASDISNVEVTHDKSGPPRLSA